MTADQLVAIGAVIILLVILIAVVRLISHSNRGRISLEWDIERDGHHRDPGPPGHDESETGR